MSTAVLDEPMAKKAANPKTAPIRVTDEAIGLVRIASGYTGESVAEYVSRVLIDVARQDIERLHGSRFGQSKPKR